MTASRLKCPTCRAGLRGQTPCPRCGTDLAPLMQVIQEAHRLREAARNALNEGDGGTACAYAIQAWRLHHTEEARVLLILSLLANGQTRRARDLLRPADLEPAPS